MDNSRWLKIKEIFYPALELPTAARRNFIEKKCADDESLREEIEKLLIAHEAAEDFIESPTVAVKNLLADETSSLIGEQIGAYKIEREIGRGGMGAVYLAERADELYKKQVAVKLIKRGLDTDEIIRRFRHERQILATLDHPNIARLIDGGATADDLPFLEMDFVEGEPLIKFCRENSLSINERLKIFLQICAAVAYAHRNLIVHRDLKPSNILVTKDGTPKLLDFGIAKLLTLDADFTTLQTANNLGAMTPEYASPEQVKGETVTTATDVYSLGVLLYELLTDARPYNFTTRSLDKIVHTICEVEPTRPSTVISQQLSVISSDFEEKERNPKSRIRNPKLLKGDLDNIVLTAMRKEPARRYSSVEQFADDIRRHLDGLPVSAQPDKFGYRAGKFVKRNKTGVAATGIALSLIGGVIGTYRQSKIAARERDAALAEAKKAERINRFLQKMLASADPREQGKDVKVAEILEIAAKSLDKDFADEPEIIADLQTTIGLTFLAQGKHLLAEPLLQKALETRLEIFGREHHDSAISIYNFGKLAEAKGDITAAETYYWQSLEILRRLFGDKHLEISNVLHHLAYILGLQGKNDEAIRMRRKELEIRRALLDENHPEIAQTLTALGSLLTLIGETEAAEPLQRKALDVIRRFYGDEHPDTANILVNLFAAIQHKNPVEAEKLAVESLRIRRKVLGDSHPEVAWSLYHLSFLKINTGEFAEAGRLTQEILNRRGTTLTDENPLISSALLILGRSLMAQNNLPAAEKILRECLALRRANLSPEHWLLATTNGSLGECLMLMNQTETGKSLLIESYENLREKLGENHTQTKLARARIVNLKLQRS